MPSQPKKDVINICSSDEETETKEKPTAKKYVMSCTFASENLIKLCRIVEVVIPKTKTSLGDILYDFIFLVLFVYHLSHILSRAKGKASAKTQATQAKGKGKAKARYVLLIFDHRVLLTYISVTLSSMMRLKDLMAKTTTMNQRRTLTRRKRWRKTLQTPLRLKTARMNVSLSWSC